MYFYFCPLSKRKKEKKQILSCISRHTSESKNRQITEGPIWSIGPIRPRLALLASFSQSHNKTTQNRSIQKHWKTLLFSSLLRVTSRRICFLATPKTKAKTEALRLMSPSPSPYLYSIIHFSFFLLSSSTSLMILSSSWLARLAPCRVAGGGGGSDGWVVSIQVVRTREGGRVSHGAAEFGVLWEWGGRVWRWWWRLFCE